MSKAFKPTNFGRYMLTERIAVGGMAEIFAGKIFGAMGFEKQVVIKRILPQFGDDAEFLRMFVTEAKLVCHLEHPNIVQVHELGEIDSQYYIAMEMVGGIDGRQMWRTLAKRKQRLPGVLALFVVAEFLKGLDYAHRAVGPDNKLLGVVHRDVSPSNILISFRGDVKIGDFGIALVQQESKTQAGVLKGKYGYMSPEQVAGLKVDHRSDIFAGGIVLAELLLGRRLFLGRSDFETLDKVMNVRLDVLEQHEKALPPEVVRIVRLALQRDASDRYQSAREFHDDIMEFLYERRERVTNETLAAFIAQHVRPHLAKRSSGDGDGAPAVAQSPVLPKGIVPRDLEVTPAPSGVEEERRQAEAAAAAAAAAQEVQDDYANAEAEIIVTDDSGAADEVVIEDDGNGGAEAGIAFEVDGGSAHQAQRREDPMLPPPRGAEAGIAFEIDDGAGADGAPMAAKATDIEAPLQPRDTEGDLPSSRAASRASATTGPDYGAPDAGPRGYGTGPGDYGSAPGAGPGDYGSAPGTGPNDYGAAPGGYGAPDAGPAGYGAPMHGGGAGLDLDDGAGLDLGGDAGVGLDLGGDAGSELNLGGESYGGDAYGASAPQEAAVPLWDNVVDDNYQFGAIPQYEMDADAASFTGELDLDAMPDADLYPPGFAPGGGAALGQPAVAGAGEELDLGGDDDDGDDDFWYVGPALVTPEVAAAQAADEIEKLPPGQMMSAQLVSAEEAKDAAKPDFRGKLTQRTATKVLFRFAVVNEDGLLTLTGPESDGEHAKHVAWLHDLQASLIGRNGADGPSTQRTCEIHLQEGQPHVVAADRSEHALIAYLLRTGALDKHGVEKAIRANPHRSLVAAMLAAGLLAPLQITRHVTSFVIDSVIDSFGWSQGSFAFYRGKECSNEAFPTGLDALELIQKGVAALPEAALEAYFSPIKQQRIGPNPAPPTHIEDFPPDTLLTEVYRTLGAERRVKDTIAACKRHGSELDVQRVLYKLIECEMATLG